MEAVVAINNVARLDMDRTAPSTYPPCQCATGPAIADTFTDNRGENRVLILGNPYSAIHRTIQ
jgi:hypothetical protein